MCELLGMSANVPTDICFSFTGLVQRGGRTGPHKDGWGITFYEGNGCRTFKDPQPSFDSPIARLVQEYPIKSCAVVSHIRQANRGEVALENTHPFTRELWGRNWTYAHNGQLKGYRQLETGTFRPVGQTDSEYALLVTASAFPEIPAYPEPLAAGVPLYRSAGGSTVSEGGIQYVAVGWALCDGLLLHQPVLDHAARAVWQSHVTRSGCRD